ncbi:unnamed protein product [Moneuplotes crassus]|uniref:Uncharacterized protein n=1 Tax=Euplotes crassus TaxID=5936 RepID=A0AAD1XVQ1_EUPCR|nr:unnamed protein product [Moneuplotes crassus]
MSRTLKIYGHEVHLEKGTGKRPLHRNKITKSPSLLAKKRRKDRFLKNAIRCCERISIRRTLREKLNFDSVAEAYTTPEKEQEYMKSYNEEKPIKDCSSKKCRKVTITSDVNTSDTKPRSMSIDTKLRRNSQKVTLLGINGSATISEATKLGSSCQGSNKILPTTKEVRLVTQKLQKLTLNPESLYFSDAKKLTDKFLKESKIKGELETSIFKDAMKKCKNLKKFKKTPSILRAMKRGDSKFEDSLDILQNLRDKVAKDIILEEDEQDNDPMQELIDANTKKQCDTKVYKPLGCTIDESCTSDEDDIRGNHNKPKTKQPSFMAPLETRMKIMSSLYSNTPNIKRMKTDNNILEG